MINFVSNTRRGFRKSGRPRTRGKPLVRGKPQRIKYIIETTNKYNIEGRKIMKMIKKNFQKIAAFLIAAIMCLSVMTGTLVAKAADDTVINENATGSITVTKYATDNMDGENPRTVGDATGTTGDNTAITVDGSYKPVADATFKLFRIANASDVMKYYDGEDTSSYEASKFNYDAENNKATYDGTNVAQVGSELKTNNNGICTFENLAVGIYALVETSAPDKITAPLAETTIISIPMVNTATSSNNGNSKWIYDVYVYPKNHESTGTVELTKVNKDDNPLEGAEFKLESIKLKDGGELDGNDWNEISGNLKTSADGIITVSDLPAGLYGTQYRLTETKAPDGYFIDSTPLYFKVNKNNTVTWNNLSGENGDCNNLNAGVKKTPVSSGNKLTIELSNEQVSFDKKVKLKGETDAWDILSSYNMGEKINYKLTAFVPSSVEQFDTFTITDSPAAGITDNIDSVIISYGAGNLTKSMDYDVTEKANGFEITFTPDGKEKIKGKNIEINYTAYLNDQAAIGENGNVNTATLTYSTGGTGTATKTIDGTATIKTYNYKITKYKDNVADNNKISGVHFTLLDSSDKAIDVVKKADGSYRLAIPTDADNDKTTDLVTAADGTISIDGLGNGTYKLKETKTIDGYNLLSKPHEFTINGASDTGTIINKKGFVLPKTGSMGFILFCVLGLALIAGGALLIFGGKRTKKIR